MYKTQSMVSLNKQQYITYLRFAMSMCFSFRTTAVQLIRSGINSPLTLYTTVNANSVLEKAAMDFVWLDTLRMCLLSHSVTPTDIVPLRFVALKMCIWKSKHTQSQISSVHSSFSMNRIRSVDCMLQIVVCHEQLILKTFCLPELWRTWLWYESFWYQIFEPMGCQRWTAYLKKILYCGRLFITIFSEDWIGLTWFI